MADESSRTPTKWNIDDDRMRALSSYLILAEDAFNSFTSYEGMRPIENLDNRLGAIKRALHGAGSSKDDNLLMEYFSKLEKEKRNCTDIFLYETEYDKGFKQFVPATIKFFNVAEETYATIMKICTKNGYFFRRAEDPGRAVEMT